jgi:hypothetical protein
VKETKMLVISEDYKKILTSAAKADGQMLLFTNDTGEWYLNIVDLRLPEKQSRYASAKIRETVADLLKQGLVRFEGPPGQEDGLYTVTVKGFEECGLKE